MEAIEEDIGSQISELESMFFTLNKHEMEIRYGDKEVTEEDLANLEPDKDKNFIVTLKIMPERENMEG